jgi:UDP-N-acetylglucosamine 2-epimerase (non-hydrolysing)
LKKILFIFGTRPEAIKMAPLIRELENDTKSFQVKICITAQHREMLDQVLDFFSIKPHYDLHIMQAGQSLFDITARVVKALEPVFDECKPDLVLVQGDTTTAFVGALAAFYKQVKVGHVEAGLRSFDRYSPFPEEMNRKLVTSLTDFYFAPTKKAAENLVNESIHSNVFITGNTVIDALLMGKEMIESDTKYSEQFPFLDTGKKIILVTGHRRESFGKPFEDFCNAIATIASKYPDVQIIYPVHLNPRVQEPVKRILSDAKNIFLVEPVDYPSMIWLMNNCYFVLTDSGGVQEEAPSLGKPVLVSREVTERIEGIEAGTAILVGTDKINIVDASIKLLEKADIYIKMATALNPYGDGTASKQIAKILKEKL